MQKDKLTLLRRELAHVRSSGRLSFYRATARDWAGFACEVAWYHKSEDSLAYQQAGNLLHATQIASKVQKRCIRRKIFHSQCNAMSQTRQKELFLCRNSPKSVAKQEKYATLFSKTWKKVAWRTSTEFLQNLTFLHCNITSNDLILSYVNLVRVFSLCLPKKIVLKRRCYE